MTIPTHVLDWCREQAEAIMAISAGCASTHGDPGGGFEQVNSIASDIAINLQLHAAPPPPEDAVEPSGDFAERVIEHWGDPLAGTGLGHHEQAAISVIPSPRERELTNGLLETVQTLEGIAAALAETDENLLAQEIAVAKLVAADARALIGEGA